MLQRTKNVKVVIASQRERMRDLCFLQALRAEGARTFGGELIVG